MFVALSRSNRVAVVSTVDGRRAATRSDDVTMFFLLLYRGCSKPPRAPGSKDEPRIALR